MEKAYIVMTYLQRIDYRPTTDHLTAEEQEFLREHFMAYGAEMVVDGQPVQWEHIQEVEVVPAPRAAGPAGWLVKKLFLHGQDRYHVGVYFGAMEAVLPNITWDTARYVVETVAYYAPQPVVYKGPENLVRLTEI